MATAPVLAAATSATVTANSTVAYFRIAYSGTPTWVRVYVDSDRSTGTGYSVYGVGANYMIENGRLYRYSGSNGSWAWTFVKTVTYAKGTGVATVNVARADIGSPLAFNAVTETAAPSVTSSILAVAYTTTTAPAPTP
ncbi:hypothetical protein, partial [Massilia sp. IC2-477]|uniref:hypothetical protein n=1 Tax=Massilia sp. IC2-477 TaxID=2887198 RepID=UPI001D101C1A